MCACIRYESLIQYNNVARNAVKRAQKATVYIIIKIIYDIVRKTNTRRLNIILYIIIYLYNKRLNIQLEYTCVPTISYRIDTAKSKILNIENKKKNNNNENKNFKPNMFIGSPYNILLHGSFAQTLWRQNKNDDKAFSRLPFYCRHWHLPPPPIHIPFRPSSLSPIEQIFTIRHNNNSNNIYIYKP